MKLPENSVIAPAKIRSYLLQPKARNDKSKFLNGLGFTLQNPQDLEQAIRQIVLENNATIESQTPFGKIYVVQGVLKGGGGSSSPVKTIWIERIDSRETVFITLVPTK
jgi:hypothetical protein